MGLAVLAGVGLMCVSGCADRAEVYLHQDFAPSSQQHVHLSGDWAYRAGATGRERCLLAFPLPGSTAGPRDFVIYMTLPDRLGKLAVDPADPDAVRGFLVQCVGALAGRTGFSSGVVKVKRPWWARTRRTLDVDIRCEDGTVIQGKATLRIAPGELASFEQSYAADIELLLEEGEEFESGGGSRGRPARR
jgi:hypothetical protein